MKNGQILIPPVLCLMQKNEFPLEFGGLNLKEVDSCTGSPLLVWFLLMHISDVFLTFFKYRKLFPHARAIEYLALINVRYWSWNCPQN